MSVLSKRRVSSHLYRSGTVTLDGISQEISGATTFNNLTKTTSAADTLTLPASTTNIIAGSLTLVGNSGNLLSLVSSTPGVQNSLNPQGTRTVQYLNVQDNNNLNSIEILCSIGCTDFGNNTNWAFASSVTANAGPNRTITTNSSINLDGSSSSGTSLVYSWAITATTGAGGISQAGTITNPTSDTPLYTAPSTAQVVTITLTVTSSAGSVTPSTATVQMTILSPNNVSKTTASNNFVGFFNGLSVIEQPAHTLSNFQSTIALTIGNLNVILPIANSGYTFTMTPDNLLVIGLPSVNNDTGQACFSTLPVTQFAGTIDLNEPDPLNLLCINGSQSNGLFGKYIGMGDFDGNGLVEILIGAPGQGDYGTVYLYNLDYNVVATILGSSTYRVTSVLTGDYLTTTTADILFGPNNPALNPNLAFQNSVPSSSQTSEACFLGNNSGFSGVVNLADGNNGAAGDLTNLPPPSKEETPESQPESQPSPNNVGITYNSEALGEINGDGITDLILVSSSGSVYIFFGKQTIDTTLTLADANVIITGGSLSDNFGNMVLTGDVTGDGINDIVIGATAYSNNTGAVYIIFGATSWESTMTLSNAQVMLVTGDNPGDQIGSDLLIFDATADGISEIYTPRANGSILVINLFPSAPVPISEVTAGGGCSINSKSSGPISFYLSFLSCLSIHCDKITFNKIKEVINRDNVKSCLFFKILL